MNLHRATRVVLVRCKNGWVAHDDADNFSQRDRQFVFESTESLQRQLVNLLGKSEWVIEPAIIIEP